MPSTAPVTTLQWRDFLTATAQRELDGASNELGRPGNAPATEADLAAAESRLGTRLPPSYRNYLLTSNGWPDTPGFYGAFGFAEFGWLREVISDLVEAWADVEDDEIDRILNRCLVVGATDNGDHWLLDPTEVGAGDEWAAYVWWAGDDGSFIRHNSFGALAVAVNPVTEDDGAAS